MKMQCPRCLSSSFKMVVPPERGCAFCHDQNVTKVHFQVPPTEKCVGVKAFFVAVTPKRD